MTLEDQLAAYGRQRSEAQAPIMAEELIGRSALDDTKDQPGHDVGDSPDPILAMPRLVRARSGPTPRMLAGWQVGVAIAIVTLLGFGVISLLIASRGPSDIEGSLGEPSQVDPALRRSISVDGIELSFRVPTSKWESRGDFLIARNLLGDEAPEAIIYFTALSNGTDALPCPGLPLGQLPPTTNIDLIASSVGPPADPYTVGGLRGRFSEIQVADDTGCNPGYLYSWTSESDGTSWTESKRGDIVDAWFVKVEDEVLAVVAQTRGRYVRLELGSEIFGIVESIRFPSVPPTPSADYIVDLNTGETTLLPAEIRGQAPSQYAISPDGSMVAYVAPDSDGYFQVFTAKIDGTGIRQATHDAEDAGSPSWSVDGSLLAYVVSERLFVLDRTTGEPRQIPNLRVGFGTQFTPDGSSILYTTPARNDFELWTVPIDGGTSRLLIGRAQGVAAGSGSMSPDGSLVTFLGNEIFGPGALRFLAKTEGPEPKHMGQLNSGNCGGGNPAGAWSPDGTRIVCAGDNEVRVVDITTGEAVIVAEGKAAIWLDDHTLLVEAWGESG